MDRSDLGYVACTPSARRARGADPGAQERWPPRCGFNAATEAAAEQLVSSWWAMGIHPQCVSASDLAVEFVRDLKRFPIFAGLKLRGTWLKGHYPLFCRSRDADVPYKDFAKELATMMPRSRGEEWCRGRRTTFTRYLLPADNVVENRRRRAQAGVIGRVA
jgi:hypothetical protein